MTAVDGQSVREEADTECEIDVRPSISHVVSRPRFPCETLVQNAVLAGLLTSHPGETVRGPITPHATPVCKTGGSEGGSETTGLLRALHRREDPNSGLSRFHCDNDLSGLWGQLPPVR